MDILEKLNNYLEFSSQKMIVESGIRNIGMLAKTYKEAEIYFHLDLDGVTSAIAIKTYLKKYGIKTIDANPIQYGSGEYSVPKTKKHLLSVMVDFAHGKPTMQIHTDHHDKQIGMDLKKTSTSFVKAASNLEYISAILPNSDIFPKEDSRLISMVDSADFAKNNITPDDVMRASFNINKNIDVTKNKKMMGLVVNKLLLSYKNKPNFLKELVLISEPSLINMYINIVKIAKKYGYAPPKDIEAAGKDYVEAQKINKNVNMVGNTIVQYGAGIMRKTGAYDRYTPFKNNPNAHFLCIAWPLGLVQLSKNPFLNLKNPYHLGDIANKILEKFKSKLSKKVSLYFIKMIFETEIKSVKDQMGFTYNDMVAIFDDKIKLSDKQRKWLKSLMNKKIIEFNDDEKKFLYGLKISVWDIIKAQSGGHKDITNISGWQFYGKGYVDLMKEYQKELVKEMSNKELE